jgi:hypothetical protein
VTGWPHAKITVSCKRNRLKFYIFLILYVITNVAAGRMTQPGGSWVGHSWCKKFVGMLIVYA